MYHKSLFLLNYFIFSFTESGCSENAARVFPDMQVDESVLASPGCATYDERRTGAKRQLIMSPKFGNYFTLELIAEMASDPDSQVMEAVAVARRILSKKVGLIEGVRKLNDLAWDLDDDGLDTRFDVFRAFESKTLGFPPESARERWNPNALVKIDAQTQNLENEHRPSIDAACRALIRSYGHEL